MRVNIASILLELKKQIDGSKKLITAIKISNLRQIQKELVIELAFLRIFIAWENFLEDSFFRYLVGGKSYSGKSPIKFINPPTIKKATEIVTGEKNKYIKWNLSEENITRSEIYFKNGEPYKNTLQTISTDIKNMNTIRNRITHRSKASKDNFREFIRQECGHGIKGMTPGRFLLRNNPKTKPIITYFDYYSSIVEKAGSAICK
jgi:hypothetical protein